MNKILFVTCGATVPFPKLIQSVVSPEFLGTITTKYGFTKVIIQYGKGYTEEFNRLLEGRYVSVSKQPNKYGCSQYLEYRLDGEMPPLEIVGLEYSTQIQDIIGQASLVISHAGTGSILDTLRQRHSTPLIVVVNDDLMDNHQEQIAHRFTQMGYVLSCHAETPELINAVSSVEKKAAALKPFPQSHNSEFAQLLIQTAGH